MTAKQTESVQNLRRRAEKRVREIPEGGDFAAWSPEQLVVQSPEQVQQTLHDLRVHQIELEMQNEELRRAQTELDAARARYFDLYDLAPVGYVTISEQGLILEANLTAATLLGVARGALVNRPLSLFILREHQDLYYQRRTQLFESREPQAFELRMVKHDGTPFWAGLAATAAQAPATGSGQAPSTGSGQAADGALVGGVVLTDVTERKRAEEALRENEERLHLAMKASNTGLYDLNIRTGEALVNAAYAVMLGYDPAEFHETNAKWIERLHPDDKQRVAAVYSAYVSGAIPEYNVEFRQKTMDGHWKWMLSLGRIMERDKDGNPVRMLGTHFDITDRKRAEAEREELQAQNRQLQKAESLGRMAGAIAHQFNNQLQVVTGNLEMALDGLPEGGRVFERLTEALRATRRASEVSSRMLTYVGHTPTRRKPLDLAEVCRRDLPLLVAAIPKHVVLESELPSPGPVASADAAQIHHVVTNLVTNAWEAAGDGQGFIHLIVKTVSAADISTSHRFPIDAQVHSGAYACLEVADTGCGITATDIERLFDPFFSSKFTGRGMGLPVVLGIVRTHGGILTVESEPGSGSVFRVYLPLIAEMVAEMGSAEMGPDLFSTPHSHVEDRSDPVCHGGGTVLVVEDEALVRNIAASMLTRLGFHVLTAPDGVEAVEVFRHHSADIRCVLCDLTMPRMDGWETLTALRHIAPGIPVILVSGYDDAHVLKGEHPERPQAYLRKPYRRAQLDAAIRRVLAHEHVL